MGRGATVNGNGRAVYPPGVHTPMKRYWQPPPRRRNAWQVVRTVVLWVVLATLVVASGMAGAAYLKTHEFLNAIAPKTKADRAAARHLDLAIPGQPTIALVIGTDRRKGKQAELTGRSDTLILVRADPGTNSLSMLSFPRDLIATIKCPGHPDTRDRINAAFSFCGTVGSVETVRALTGLPINYFITVDFKGFTQLVNNLGGVWLDIDHRYLCDASNCPGVSQINLLPGYQRVNATNALAYVRFRHFDSDLYRNARQQLFLKALKQQVSSQMDLSTVFKIMNVIEKNVVAHGLPGGHVFQSKIEGLTGANELSATPESIAAAVRDFVQPDVNAPQKARDVTLGIRRRSLAPLPRNISTTVLNGNGVAGSAANAAYELGQRGYKVVLPPSGKTQHAPTFRYFRTTVYYDPAQRRSKAAATKLANLFGDADVKPLPPTVTTLSNGAMATVVVGQNFHGTIAPAPVDKTPTKQPALVTPNAAMTRALLLQANKRVRFRLQVPRLVESSSRLEFDSPIRVYGISKGHRAVRLTFRIGSNEYWGIEETNWNDAPALADPSFVQKIKGREYALYYAGPHLHMVVLRKDGATYWVINSVLDELSNETMLAIARGFAPLPK